MTEFTKEMANYVEPPYDGYRAPIKFLKSLYPCWRCKHWLGGKKDGETFPDAATCELVEGVIAPTANCFYWSFFGVRPNIEKSAELVRNVVKKE